jgi:hypothetical protein
MSINGSTFICPSPLVYVDPNLSGYVIWAYEPGNCASPCPTIEFTTFEWNQYSSAITALCIVSAISSFLVLLIYIWQAEKFYTRLMFLFGFFLNSIVLTVFLIKNRDNSVSCNGDAHFDRQTPLCVFQAATMVFSLIWIETWSVIIAVDTYYNILSYIRPEKRYVYYQRYTLIAVLVSVTVTIIPLIGNNYGFDQEANIPICLYLFSENPNYFWYTLFAPFTILNFLCLTMTIAGAFKIHNIFVKSNRYVIKHKNAMLQSPVISVDSDINEFKENYDKDMVENGGNRFSTANSSFYKYSSQGDGRLSNPLHPGDGTPGAVDDRFVSFHGNNDDDMHSEGSYTYNPYDGANKGNFIMPSSSSSITSSTLEHAILNEYGSQHRQHSVRQNSNIISSSSVSNSFSHPNNILSPDSSFKWNVNENNDISILSVSHEDIIRQSLLPPNTTEPESNNNPNNKNEEGALSVNRNSKVFTLNMSLNRNGQSSDDDVNGGGSLPALSTNVRSSNSVRQSSQTFDSTSSLQLGQKTTQGYMRILKSVLKYNGRSILFVFSFCLSCYYIMYSLLNTNYFNYDKYIDSAEDFIQCLVTASFICPIQTQSSVDHFAEVLCGQYPNPRPPSKQVNTITYKFYSFFCNIFCIVFLRHHMDSCLWNRTFNYFRIIDCPVI